MTSGEMKVMVFAALILGIGFVYTTVMDRQGFTGQATAQGYADYSYEDQAIGYEENYVTEPAPYGYREPVQPISYESPQSSDRQQKQFLTALGINKENVEEACGALDDPNHPFTSQ